MIKQIILPQNFNAERLEVDIDYMVDGISSSSLIQFLREHEIDYLLKTDLEAILAGFDI